MLSTVAIVVAYICFLVDTIIFFNLAKINENKNRFTIKNNYIYDCFTNKNKKNNKIGFIVIILTAIIYFFIAIFGGNDFVVMVLIFNAFTLNMENNILNGLLGDKSILSKKAKEIQYDEIENFLISKEKEHYNIQYSLKNCKISEEFIKSLNEEEYKNFKNFISNKEVNAIELF